MANGHKCNENEHKWGILNSFDHIAWQKVIALTKEHITIRVFTLIRMLEKHTSLSCDCYESLHKQLLSFFKLLLP